MSARPDKPSRFDSIDILRGIVIAIMALDHVRDFFSASAGLFEPTDLTRTTPSLFFTRWITHFCAPAFVLLAGIGSFQAGIRGRSPSQLSWFLLSRGLWLILVEVCLITPFGWSFQVNFQLIRLQVIWAIGCSMVVLSACVRLPSRLVGLAGWAMIVLHNAFDGSRGQLLGPLWPWLHSIQFFRLDAKHTVASLYPLVPWVGVLMAGYGLGELWTLAADRRRNLLLACAGLCLVSFVVLRATNVYGDPAPWSPQTSPLFTLMSVLNVSKYPPSFSFLTMTLGTALLLLAWLESSSSNLLARFSNFGRVPLFFYCLHLPLIHGSAILLSIWNHGSAAWLWRDPFALRRTPVAAPADYGYSLFGVYVLWLCCLALLYPVSKWYAEFKQRQSHPIWSYL